jgi:hypothetical protein
VRYVLGVPDGEVEGFAEMDTTEAPADGAELVVLYDPRHPMRTARPRRGAFLEAVEEA